MSYPTWQVARVELAAQVGALAAEARLRGARWVLATGYTRAARDFATADTLRAQLAELGYEVRDSAGASTLTRR